jgi:hypothetical protein
MYAVVGGGRWQGFKGSACGVVVWNVECGMWMWNDS